MSRPRDYRVRGEERQVTSSALQSYREEMWATPGKLQSEGSELSQPEGYRVRGKRGGPQLEEQRFRGKRDICHSRQLEEKRFRGKRYMP